ncbi:MAG: hypothetical protein FJ276_32090 [Planctomycetes bacterium]|nr:hypothetical protein [Planctomycetota bacterium]
MSEYQYYEFQAVDRPLTAKEMSELRSYSTRARITPTSFVNDYSFGSFKGNEDAWVEKYFDAFLYLANWGTHVLKLRLSSRLLDAATAKTYCGGDSAFVREKDDKIILSFVSEDEEGGDWVEGEGHLSSLISVRAELARGDLRTLYLGWLLRAQSGELDDDDAEPPVPPGLGQLSASLGSLAEFLRIDGDLLHVAAEASPPMGDTGLDRNEVRVWVGKLPTKEKDEFITNLVVDADQAQIAELLQRFLKQRAMNGGPATTGRTVGQLLRAAPESWALMAMGRARKPAAPHGPRRTKPKTRSTSTLDKMVPSELATVLRALLAKHPELSTEAEQIAIDMIAAPSAEAVADEVHDAVTALSIESFHGRAGKQAWGYVEPTEAAWELLGEAVEDVLADMHRRADLGLHKAAEAICCGIVLGLQRATVANSDGPLGWAPDFPAEEACHAVAELIRATPPRDQGETRNRLVETLLELVPSWGEMITRAADRAVRGSDC